MTIEEIFVAIGNERRRQIEKHRGQTIADEMPLDKKLRILVEEVGEVAEAIDVLEKSFDDNRRRAKEHLKDEIVQVAACAVGWLESLD